MGVNLYSKCSGDGPPVVLLHGLFGAGGNLGALARSLQDHYRVCAVDLPNHGRSAWIENTGIAAMADCLRQWLAGQGLASASFVGHSLGGKVAMQLALESPGQVDALVVADIAPVPYPPHHDQVFAGLNAVAAAGCESREEAAQLLSRHLVETSVVQFLLTNLQRDVEGIYRWRFNLEGIQRGYGAVRDGLASRSPYTGPVVFIKGGDSDYIQEAHRGTILGLFPHAVVKVMPGCGHWLHAEQPRLFSSIVGRFLDTSLAPKAG